MFSPFERMLAFRYLRSRKAEGFVSVIAGFSFMGIMLGVATLIIVMSVMNGFREELFSRILGLNGHMNVYSLQGPLDDYVYLRQKVLEVPGINSVTPIIERRGAPIVRMIAISWDLSFTSMIMEEIILNAATTMINVRIRNITLRST